MEEKPKKPSDEEIIEGWEKIGDYEFSGLLPEEAEMFRKAALEHEISKKSKFCLPPCKDFPNCECGRHNAMVRRKYGLG